MNDKDLYRELNIHKMKLWNVNVNSWTAELQSTNNELQLKMF